MKYIRIYARDDGSSYIADEVWPVVSGHFTPPSPSGYFVTDLLPTKGALMMHHPAGYRDEWHCAPTPVLGTVLTGSVRIRTSDEDTRVLHAGDQFLAADLVGSGHIMESINDAAYDLALIILDVDSELAA